MDYHIEDLMGSRNNYQIFDKGVVGYPLIFSRDENIRRGRRPSWIFLGETEYQGYPITPASNI